ncbi:classical arabinogalactan protein 9-like [Lactuca sativa]|uniref:classical arabinogalactan protein 9-like n=1 Tax=Lactuca sativa TaxID=4236 RepID=UPI0022AF2A4E|nr:classical arabinogalactan protein 9-like [Lactuca sativa]
MARRNLTSSPSHSGPKDEQSVGDDDEGQHKGSHRGNTPPRSPTPVDLVNDSVPTPPPSPPKTTFQVTVAPPPPSSTPLVSTIAPLPPVISTPITTAPLPPPIFSNATITSTPIITSTIDSSININTSDVGAKTEEPPKVTTEPPSPTPSSDSNPILRGADFEFDSTYYSPYQIPTMNQYKKSIDKCTVAIDDSTSLCKRASSDVKDLIHDSKVFLDSLKGHADSNAAKLT